MANATNDIETGAENTTLLQKKDSSFFSDPATGEQEKPYNSSGDGVGVFVCCLCCFKAQSKKKVYFPEPRIVTDGLFAVLWALTFFAGLVVFLRDLTSISPKILAKDIKSTTTFMTDKQRSSWFSLFACALAACVMSLIIAYVNIRYATRGFVQFCGLSCLAFIIAMAVVSQNPWMLIFIAMISFFMYALRKKLPLSVEVIRASMEAVWAHKAVLILPMFSMIFHTIWLALCLLVYARLHSFNWHESDEKAGQYFACLFGLFFYWIWTAELVRYLVDYITSSVVASWVCFDTTVAGRRDKVVDEEHKFQANYPTTSAFRFAFFHNLGTIALASLVIAAIETLKFVVEIFGRDNDGRETCVACIIKMLLNCIRDQLDYMNKYVITYCAIFNTSFCQGTQEFQYLMQESGFGFTSFFQDEVTGIIVMGAAVTIGMVTAAITMSAGVLFFGIVRYSTVGVMAFVFGTVVSLGALGVVKSAVTSLFICLVAPETSPVFEENHPESYARLSTAFKSGNDATREFFSWLPSCFCVCF